VETREGLRLLHLLSSFFIYSSVGWPISIPVCCRGLVFVQEDSSSIILDEHGACEYITLSICRTSSEECVIMVTARAVERGEKASADRARTQQEKKSLGDRVRQKIV
jgi:hypothetical protein